MAKLIFWCYLKKAKLQLFTLAALQPTNLEIMKLLK